jgi:hypothetical protein
VAQLNGVAQDVNTDGLRRQRLIFKMAGRQRRALGRKHFADGGGLMIKEPDDGSLGTSVGLTQGELRMGYGKAEEKRAAC